MPCDIFLPVQIERSVQIFANKQLGHSPFTLSNLATSNLPTLLSAEMPLLRPCGPGFYRLGFYQFGLILKTFGLVIFGSVKQQKNLVLCFSVWSENCQLLVRFVIGSV
jgi:hypothetical protein